MKGIISELHLESDFSSFYESQRFEQILKRMLEEKKIKEIPVELPFFEPIIKAEHWYEDCETGEVYRYVPPEFPFKGVWEKIR